MVQADGWSLMRARVFDESQTFFLNWGGVSRIQLGQANFTQIDDRSYRLHPPQSGSVRVVSESALPAMLSLDAALVSAGKAPLYDDWVAQGKQGGWLFQGVPLGAHELHVRFDRVSVNRLIKHIGSFVDPVFLRKAVTVDQTQKEVRVAFTLPRTGFRPLLFLGWSDIWSIVPQQMLLDGRPFNVQPDGRAIVTNWNAKGELALGAGGPVFSIERLNPTEKRGNLIELRVPRALLNVARVIIKGESVRSLELGLTRSFAIHSLTRGSLLWTAASPRPGIQFPLGADNQPSRDKVIERVVGRKGIESPQTAGLIRCKVDKGVVIVRLPRDVLAGAEWHLDINDAGSFVAIPRDLRPRMKQVRWSWRSGTTDMTYTDSVSSELTAIWLPQNASTIELLDGRGVVLAAW